MRYETAYNFEHSKFIPQIYPFKFFMKYETAYNFWQSKFIPQNYPFKFYKVNPIRQMNVIF